ncbi:hypothetical protein JOD43_003683 [Pullulanibacillus pueri]|nr:hypothetical protein [Pullulanibacillus pueri]
MILAMHIDCDVTGRWISAPGRSLSSCPQDVGRIGVVTGRDDFNRSSLVASANLGCVVEFPLVFTTTKPLFLRLLVWLRRQLSRNNSKCIREVTLAPFPKEPERLLLQSTSMLSMLFEEKNGHLCFFLS